MLIIPEFLNSILIKPIILPYRNIVTVATVLGVHGYRSGSLNLSGAITASILGYLTLANPLKLFGICLLVFYFVGSRITKFKAYYKSTLEENEKSSNSKSTHKVAKTGGNRSSIQVISNALFGTICAVIWRVIYSGEFSETIGWNGRLWNSEDLGWCVLDERWGYSKILVLGAISFFSACSGDTFASELGILSASPPFLITTLRSVFPGTNGGVSPLGLLLSAIGGTLIGSVAALSIYFEAPECSLFTCGNSVGLELPWWSLPVLVGAWSGFIGSMVGKIFLFLLFIALEYLLILL